MSVDRNDREYLAAGYALGGLSADDLAAAQRLLDTDPSFQREVAAFEDSLAGMAEADGPLTVSAETEAAILAVPRTSGVSRDSHQAVPTTPTSPDTQTAPDTQTTPDTQAGQASPDIQASAHTQTESAADDAPAAEAPAQSDDSVAEVVSLEELRASRRRWRVLAGVAAAAVVVAVAGLGGALMEVSGEQREMGETLAQSQEELARAEQLLSAPDVRTDTVAMGEDAGMTVVWSTSEQVFQVRPHGVTVPDDRDMQLWIIDDTGAHSVGFLADGPVTIDGTTFADGALLGVTNEPAGGSPSPTSDPLAVVEL